MILIYLSLINNEVSYLLMLFAPSHFYICEVYVLCQCLFWQFFLFLLYRSKIFNIFMMQILILFSYMNFKQVLICQSPSTKDHQKCNGSSTNVSVHCSLQGRRIQTMAIVDMSGELYKGLIGSGLLFSYFGESLRSEVLLQIRFC